MGVTEIEGRQMSELLVNGVTVVFEGCSRLIWKRTAAASWTLIGVWPSRERQHEFREAVCSGGKSLVVLSAGQAQSALFEEEFPETFEQGVPAECGLTVKPDPEAGLVDVEVLPLNWLPEEDRANGLRFAEWARHQVATLPALGLPHLLVDDQPQRNVRFAYPTRPVTREHVRLLEPFVSRLFREGGPS